MEGIRAPLRSELSRAIGRSISPPPSHRVGAALENNGLIAALQKVACGSFAQGYSFGEIFGYDFLLCQEKRKK